MQIILRNLKQLNRKNRGAESLSYVESWTSSTISDTPKLEPKKLISACTFSYPFDAIESQTLCSRRKPPILPFSHSLQFYDYSRRQMKDSMGIDKSKYSVQHHYLFRLSNVLLRITTSKSRGAYESSFSTESRALRLLGITHIMHIRSMRIISLCVSIAS